MKCRLLLTGKRSGYWNMALDEAILSKVGAGESPPTLRLYGWVPPCVSIGYFQGLREEVDLEECFREGVEVVRRLTGGGAVFHDKEITYSIIAKEKEFPKDVMKSYQKICSGLTAGFANLGVKSEFAPLNDILSGGKKISGNAQTRRMGCVLQHGTVLLDVDVERMFSLLKVPNEKVRDKMVKSVKERVTSVRHVLKQEVAFSKAEEAFADGFASALNLKLTKGKVKQAEARLADELVESKYSTLEWNNRR